MGLIVSLVNHAVKLVRSCEFSQTMQMPKLVGLVTQLEKELDIKKIIKDVKPHESGKRFECMHLFHYFIVIVFFFSCDTQ